jgi:CheY-like chemotaxis protein
MALSAYLEARGYRIAIAQNGSEALEMTSLTHPAAILMDLQMPVMDGLQATRLLRRQSDPKLANTPVIALTALALPGDRARALAAGANDYLSKPVDMGKLVEVIGKLIEHG